MNTYFQDDTVTIYHGDTTDILPTLPDKSVQAVVPDPPYGVNIAEWDSAIPTQAVLDECHRISRGCTLWFGSCTPAAQLAIYSLTPLVRRMYIWHTLFTKTISDGAYWE